MRWLVPFLVLLLSTPALAISPEVKDVIDRYNKNPEACLLGSGEVMIDITMPDGRDIYLAGTAENGKITKALEWEGERLDNYRTLYLPEKEISGGMFWHYIRRWFC